MNLLTRQEKADRQKIRIQKNRALTKWFMYRGITPVRIYRGKTRTTTDHVRFSFHVGDKEHCISIVRKKRLGIDVDNVAKAKVMEILGTICTHQRTGSFRVVSARLCVDCGQTINKEDWIGAATSPQTATEKLIISHQREANNGT